MFRRETKLLKVKKGPYPGKAATSRRYHGSFIPRPAQISFTDHSFLSPNPEAVTKSCQHNNPGSIASRLRLTRFKKMFTITSLDLFISGTGSCGEQSVRTCLGVMMVLAVPIENSETGLGEFRGRESGAAVTGVSFSLGLSGQLLCLWAMSFEFLTHVLS